MNPVIIVHGGAKEIPPEEWEAHRQGCINAANTGWEILAAGGSALDAAEAAIRVLEADGTFNAGYGSTLNPDGVVRMDAGIMEGAEQQAGGVGCVEGVRHPIQVARRMVSEKTVLMAADYARDFAEQNSLELCDPYELISPKQREKWERSQSSGKPAAPTNDTVGCVALDHEGNLAAGASTGGTGDHPPGRVGDSPLPGCGYLAENGVGGISFTGVGEGIMRVAGSRSVHELLRSGEDPEEAARRVVRMIQEQTGATSGCIVLDGSGRIGWTHSDPNMAVGYRTQEMPEARAYVKKSEER